MQKIHNHLLKKSAAYANWHKKSYHQMLQWAILLVVVASIATLVQLRLQNITDDSSGIRAQAGELVISENLLTNPGCESSVAGWVGDRGVVTRATNSVYAGTASCLISFSNKGKNYTFNDSPNAVNAPRAGEEYRASAWVRSDAAVGKPVQLTLRQGGGASAAVTELSQPVNLTSSWQQISASLTINATDRQYVELYVTQNNASRDNNFYIDELSLVRVTQPVEPPTTSPTADYMNSYTYSGSLFGTTSPWNSPIASSAQVDSNSNTMIQNLQLAFTNVRSFAVNTTLEGYAVPIYYADSTTGKTRVSDTTGWWDESGFAAVPIPVQAQPDPKTDRHMVVWDVPNHMVYEYWHMNKNSDGTWSAGLAAKFDDRGNGYQTGIWQPSARAYGGSLAAGTIRYQEMRDGAINHALSMSYPYTRGDYYARGLANDGTVNIASHNDNNKDASRINSYNIPEGARLRLKASVDIAQRCSAKTGASNRACVIIGQALKNYGAYVVDTGGAPTFYAENLQGKQVSWDGVLQAGDTRPFAATDFEILTLPSSLTASSAR